MTDKKKKSGNLRGEDEVVIGMAWFRREEWAKLLEVSADRDQLEETYDEWLQSARQTLLHLRAEGQRVEKVDIGVDELLKWCQTRHVPVDASARADLAAAQLHQRHAKS